MTFILFLVGLGLLIGGSELLVRGAARLAGSFGVTPLVVGLTVVAFGTSSPELAVTIQSNLNGQGDLAIGNVIGSNITNILLILGLAAVIMPLTVDQKLIRKDVPLLIGISVAMLVLGLDQRYSQFDGVLLTLGIVAYTVFAIRESRRESRRIAQEYAEEYAVLPQSSSMDRLRDCGLIILGLALLVVGSGWIVDGAVTLARLFGISELVIGLTIIAVGTSLPEIATTIMASVRGERDIAVGNVIGSCIFNILCVLGLGALLAPGGIALSPTALSFDLPVMIAVAIACLPIFVNGHAIYRWEGAVFVFYYIAYTAYLVLTASRSPALPWFETAMIGFVLPLTVITFIVVSLRAIRRRAVQA